MRSFLGDVKKNRTAGTQQFQLHFPYSGDHIQCVENAGASCNPNTRGCDGKIGITPDLNFIPRPSPTSAFANAIRQALGMPTQQTQPVTSQPMIPSQPLSSSPLDSFNPSTSTTGASSQIDTTGGMTHATSVADLLEELAFGPKTPTSTVTGMSVPLVVSGSQAVGVVSTQPVEGQQNLPSGVSGISSQTFISGDLSWQGDTVQTTEPLSGWKAIIATIRATLNRMMQLLTPFGAREQIYMDEHGEFQALE